MGFNSEFKGLNTKLIMHFLLRVSARRYVDFFLSFKIGINILWKVVSLLVDLFMFGEVNEE
jgi:hypothetical protein